MTKEMVSAFRRRTKCEGTSAKRQKLTSNDHETTDDYIDFTLGEEEDELYEKVTIVTGRYQISYPVAILMRSGIYS